MKAHTNDFALTRPSLPADIAQLTKPRITTLVTITMALGFHLATVGSFDWPLFAFAVLGTVLLSAGIMALNHWMERDVDGLMPRTSNRPLPTQRLAPDPVFYGGFAVTLAGLATLIMGTNPVAAGIGVVVAVVYVAVYTPLKRITQLNTLVGAVPGALPPVLGWAAVRGEIGPEAIALFLIMFVWQQPHFLPIAWLYRHDYKRAGMAMITVDDPGGASTRRQMVLWTATLLAISIYPVLLGMAGHVYFWGALALGVGFAAVVAPMALEATDRRARHVLKASVLYLPLLLSLLAYDATL